jgi:hypothetical protein
MEFTLIVMGEYMKESHGIAALGSIWIGTKRCPHSVYECVN